MIQDALFCRMPLEIRLMVYEYLLIGPDRKITIENRRSHPSNSSDFKRTRRTCYYINGRLPDQRVSRTTYCMANENEFHPAILAVNRQVRGEASRFLYSKHSFDFGRDTEALTPFIQDMTPYTKHLFHEIALRKGRTMRPIETDSCAWQSTCKTLKEIPRLRKLQITVEGGRPTLPWDGPQQLSVSDLRLLYATRHEGLDWLRALAGVDTVDEVEICADIGYMPQPVTSEAFIYAAMSASIESSVVEFISTELGIPAKVGPSEQNI